MGDILFVNYSPHATHADAACAVRSPASTTLLDRWAGKPNPGGIAIRSRFFSAHPQAYLVGEAGRISPRRWAPSFRT